MTGLFNRLQNEIDAEEKQDGLSPVDLLDLPVEISKAIKKIVRNHGMKLDDIAEELGQPIEQTQQLLDRLVEKGYIRKIEVKGSIWYKARFASKRGKSLSSGFWSVLDNNLGK